MASDLQKKSKHTGEAEKPPVMQQKPNDIPANSESSHFSDDKRQTQRNVYQLILHWRQRKLKATPQVALASSIRLSAEREA